MKNNSGRIFIIGYMGSGKTIVGERLAQIAEMDFIDMDSVIINEQGLSINRIFMKYGEHEFRNHEGKLLDKISEDGTYKNAVISCGSGIILDDENCRILDQETVVYLDCDPGTMYDRIKNDPDLPNAYFYNKDAKERRRIFAQQLETRKPLYEKIADITICTDMETPEHLAEKIAKELELI